MTEAARDRYSARKEKPRITSDDIAPAIAAWEAENGPIETLPIRINGKESQNCQYRACGKPLSGAKKMNRYCNEVCHKDDMRYNKMQIIGKRAGQ